MFVVFLYGMIRWSSNSLHNNASVQDTLQAKHSAWQLSIKLQLRLCRWRAADWPIFRRVRGWHHGLVLGADMAVLPGPSAPRAEDVVTGHARHSGGLALGARLQTAHRLALTHWAPGFTGVQLHSCRQSKELEVTGQFWSRHPTAKALFSINTAPAILSVPVLLVKLQFGSRGNSRNGFFLCFWRETENGWKVFINTSI